MNPIVLAHHYDEAGNKPISREGHLLFRDELIKLLNRLRTKTIIGTLVLNSLSVGSYVDVAVDHSSSAQFCFCEYPQFTPVDGIDVLVYAMLEIDGGSYSTTGVKWVARITNVSSATYATSLSLSWSRTGMVG